MDEAKPVTEETKPTTSKLTLALIAAVAILGGKETIDVATADAQAAKIVAKYIDTTEATCKTITAMEQQSTVREAINEVDSADVVVIEKVSAQYKFNPLLYMGKAQPISDDTVEVLVRLKKRDSTLFIGNFPLPTDTTVLADVNVNLQPSAPPAKE